MMGTDWTEMQKRAIKEEGNIIVSAGAGSGKTAVLSERVLYFIKEKGYHLNEFLIVTFTNLAAKEMKDRIRKKLKENNLSDADLVDSSDISTFDSFSNALVKKYHTFLNISSSFTIVDETIIEILKRKYIKEEFDKLYLEHNPLFEEMISKYCFRSDDDLKNLVLSILNEKDKSVDDTEFFNTFLEKFHSETNIKNITKKLEYMLSEQVKLLKDAVTSMPNNVINDAGEFYCAPLYSYVDGLDAQVGYDNILSFVKNEKLTYKRAPSSKKYAFDEDTKQEIKKYKDIIDKVVTSIISYPSSNDVRLSIEEVKPYSELLLQIAKTVNDKQMEFKRNKNSYAFSDIFKMAIKLVKDFKDVREEIKNKYRMIMIDEYQDNSDFQETFINYIANNNVYCVGDIKQSIYAFRNAKSENFKNKYDKYKVHNGGEAIDLVDNFRSRKEVLDGINTIFISLMTNDIGGADYLHEHIINSGNKSYENFKGQDNRIETYLYDNTLKSNESLEFEARIIAQDIIHKINSNYMVMDGNSSRPCTFSDFAIIMDRGTNFEKYISIFQEYKLPIFMEKDENITDNVVVKLLSNLLRIMVNMIKGEKLSRKNKAYKYAFLSVGRSFLYNYDDDYLYLLSKYDKYEDTTLYRDLSSLINENKDATAYTLLLKVIEKTDFYYKFIRIGDYSKNEGYVDTFLEKFKSMQSLGFGLEEFIEYLDNISNAGLKFTLSSKGTSMNSIRLINIHKSKGLEYKIVYFPTLDKQFNKMDQKSKFGFSNKYGPYFNALDSDKTAPVQIVNNYVLGRDDLSEKIRLFYVALTRVREKMIIVCKAPKDKDYELDLLNAKSFYNFYSPFIDKFPHKTIDKIGEEQLLLKTQEYSPYKYNLKEVTIESKVKAKILRASKETSLDVNKDVLKFGNKLHEALEITDFNNPDYSLINNKYIEGRVKAFLNSPLTINIKLGRIYKEYEFIDEKDNTNGIIDLLVVYDDHVDIIDYKTKHIDDEGYDKQLHVYYDFIIQKYPDRLIKMYLYSILTGEVREVN
jgi:ATP-dependent helicase/nuclease subunit A